MPPTAETTTTAPPLEPDQRRYAPFLASFLGTGFLLAAAILLAGYVVDPFLHYRDGFTHYPWGPDEHHPGYTLNRSLFKLIQYEHYVEALAPAEDSLAVLVGDSMANQIDPVAMSRATGEAWFSLAYGGATLQENIALIDELSTRPEVARIVWGVPLPRLRRDTKNEMPRSLRFADRPARHLFTVESLRGVYHALRHRHAGKTLEDPRRFETVEERVAYSVYRTRVDVGQAAVPHDLIAAADAVIERAAERGVTITLAEWPVHPVLREMIAEEMQDYAQAYDALLARHCSARVTRIGPPASEAALYYDALHLDAPQKWRLSKRLREELAASENC